MKFVPGSGLIIYWRIMIILLILFPLDCNCLSRSGYKFPVGIRRTVTEQKLGFCCQLPIDNSGSRVLVKKETGHLFKSYTILEEWQLRAHPFKNTQ